MRKDKMRLFIFTLILLLAITLYSIYQDYNKNTNADDSYFSFINFNVIFQLTT